MDIKRVELKRTPPKEPLTSLAALIRDFKWRFPRERRDTVVTVCQDLTDLGDVIQAATNSIQETGKMHHHQVKVRKDSRDDLAETLKCNRWKMLSMQDFHELFLLVEECSGWGIGPLTIYDVSVRIGAYLNLEPQRLYLHAGSWLGLKTLAIAAGKPIRANGKWVYSYEMPWDFPKYLTWDETEDFLCTYRTMFGDIHNFSL